MQLETERLILRELTLDDLGALYDVLGDSDIRSLVSDSGQWY